MPDYRIPHHIECLRPLVQCHDRKHPRDTKIPLQVRPIVVDRLVDHIRPNLHDIDPGGVLLLVRHRQHTIRRRRRRRRRAAPPPLPARGAQDQLPDLRLLEAVGPDGARLDGLEHGVPAAGLEAAQLGVDALRGERRGALDGDGDGAEEGDDAGDGLGEDAGAGVGVEGGEDALGGGVGAEDEGAVRRVEGGAEDGAQREQGGVGCEGEVGEGRGVDLLAEGVERGVGDGGDVVGVDNE